MKVLFKYARHGDGVQLYLSSFALDKLVQLLKQDEKIIISKFFARDFSKQYYLEDVQQQIDTVEALHTFVKHLAEPVLDVVEFTTGNGTIFVSLHDTVSVQRSGEIFITQTDHTDTQHLPPLFAHIVKDFFPTDISNVLIENFEKYVFVDYDADNFRVFETYDAYLEAPESSR